MSTYKTIIEELLDEDIFYIMDNYFEDGQYLSSYIGSFMSLDPCGRYHHVLSPNGISDECVDFWESLESTAESMDCWIESGEGDPTDIYLCTGIDNDRIPSERRVKP